MHEWFYLVILFAGALSVSLIRRLSNSYSALILSAFPLVVFVSAFVQITGEYVDYEIVKYQFPLFPYWNFQLSFQFDGLSLLFLLLISGVGFVVLIYSNYYMKQYAFTERFFVSLFIFMGSMAGVVISGNLFTLFLFWELTSISSYLLIGFNSEKTEARKAALQAFLISGFGGLSLLTGIILLNIVAGTTEYSELANQSEIIKNSVYYPVIFFLFLIGAITKSAQFPFHFWLPGAMQAPAPVSAFLHSATMVKAGIFLLARLNPILGDTELWYFTLTITGTVTMFLGAWFAVPCNDLKRMLAYTTVSALGILTLLIGINTESSVKAFVIFLIVHALYKAGLFMIAGNIEKKTGTRNLSELGGLRKEWPVTTAISALLLISLAGLPPMLSFISKELIFEAKINSPDLEEFIIIFGFLTNAISFFLALRIFYEVFIKSSPPGMKKPENPGLELIFAPALLALGSLLLGLFPHTFTTALATPAMQAIDPEIVSIDLGLWHGFTVVFFFSLGAYLFGSGLFYYRKYIIASAKLINSKYLSADFSQIFNKAIDKFLVVAKLKTSFIQHGKHRYYLLTIFIITVVLLWIQINKMDEWPDNIDFAPVTFYNMLLPVLIIAGAFFSVVSHSRILSLIALGVCGYGMALFFLVYSGIDLAITMFMVETLILVFAVLVVYQLPKYLPFSNPKGRARDLLVSVAFGATMAVLVLKSINLNFHPTISGYYSANALEKGYGSNIVNVILVDFRAFDTLGEITVLAIAAVGVYMLLKQNVTKK